MAVPADAWWSDADGAWVRGGRDATGALDGDAQYFTDRGELVLERTFRSGVQHGAERRYAAGTLAVETMFVDGVATTQPPRVLDATAETLLDDIAAHRCHDGPCLVFDDDVLDVLAELPQLDALDL